MSESYSQDPIDVVWDLLEIMHEMPPECDIDLLVLDFVRAFWNLPSRPDEQPFLVFQLRGGILFTIVQHRGLAEHPCSGPGLSVLSDA